MSDNKSNYDRGDYNKSGLIIFIASFGFSILLFGYLGYIHDGVDLKEVKETVQGSNEMGLAKKEVKKIDLSQITEPWVFSDDLVAHGTKVYATNCTICHGAKGLGNGPAGSGLNPPPRNLVKGGWKSGGTSKALFLTLTNGLEGTSMASFGHLKKIDRWALVHYIRSITEDKPEDDMAELESYAKGL